MTGRRDLWWRAAAGLAAFGLAAVGGIRAAGWLVGLCLLVAVAVASHALVGGTTWRAVAPGLFALPAACGHGVGWVVRSAASAGRDRRPVLRVVRGVAAGAVLLLVFGALFRAADPAFADLVARWTGALSPAALVRAALGFGLVAGVTAGAVYLARIGSTVDTSEPDDTSLERHRLGRAEWVIPVAMLDVLFAVFVWVQLTTLFAGDEYVLTPGGPDYADYARDGFAQLAAATLLTLGVVAVLALYAGRTRPDRVLLRVLGGVLCALTLVIVASALKRMGLYVHAYGFTGQRLACYAGEVWLGLMFVLLLIAGARLRAGWLPRAVVATGVAVLTAVAAANPDALMARTHIHRLDHSYPLDLRFLSNLSADAVAEIDALPEPQRSCVLARIARRLDEPDAWYRLNLGRERARALLASRPVRPTDPAECGLDEPPTRQGGLRRPGAVAGGSRPVSTGRRGEWTMVGP